AVDQVGLSRSAYYKYKDAIYPFNTMMKQKIITVSLNLEHRAGVLSKMLSYIATNRGNVLTINQTIPLQGLANVVLTIETAQMDVSVTQIIGELRNLDGVQKVVIVGQG
ncbi:MAG: ACT domain-containing protein, partial [Bacilli bacterium]